MNTPVSTTPEDSLFSTLRRFARPRKPQEEACELCSVALAPAHRHLLAMSSQKVVCSCDACALLFQNVSTGRFKLIPRDVYILEDFQLTDIEWESLSLPINLAFFFYSSSRKKIMALYPSPGGATESLLSLENWQNLEKANPVLTEIESDVEALLVNRIEDARDFYIAPIDVCFELVGLIRLHWRGFSGGETVWEEINKFFGRLRAQGKTEMPRREVSHA